MTGTGACGRSAACAAVVLAVTVSLTGCGARPAATPPGPSRPAAPASGTAAPATTAPATPATGTTAPATPGPVRPSGPPAGTPAPSRTPTAPPDGGALRPGAHGPAVLALQRRLAGLGYWLGTPDGSYGAATAHAVTAFQKVTGLARDGVVGPATAAALRRAGRPPARPAPGQVVEVDLARQVLILAVDGRTRWVFDTSTGARRGTTPTGRFTVLRQVDGYDRGPLGVLYRPKYFAGGVAVHGYPNVPPYPASHGCVRVTDAAMDWLWANGALPLGGPVRVY